MKNYIFDFGQVLVRFDIDYMTGVYIKDKKERDAVKNIIFDRLYWDRLDDGSITDSEVKRCICERVPRRLCEKATAVYDHWYENLSFVDGMEDLLLKIKTTGKKLFLVSNISKGFAENYKNVPNLNKLLSLFDGLVFSAELGIVKPNPEIFEYTLKEYGLKAEDCIFIDDNKDNIIGARKVGIKSVLFDGDVNKLKNKLLNGE